MNGDFGSLGFLSKDFVGLPLLAVGAVESDISDADLVGADIVVADVVVVDTAVDDVALADVVVVVGSAADLAVLLKYFSTSANLLYRVLILLSLWMPEDK